MPLTPSLLARLSADFPSYLLVPSDDFHWSAPEHTVYYDTASSDEAALLHEFAHARLGHHEYLKDIQLIEMERDAWQYARTELAPRYDVQIDDDAVEDALDSYREWLHARSTCPACKATGLQTQKDTYRCLACSTRWRVNEARTCALRRYKYPDDTKTPS